MGIFEGEDGPAQSYGGNQLMKLSREPNMAERLDLAVERAEKQLADAKEAREIFQRNPDLEKLINLMNRNSF